jgi:hypothetical protein
MQPLLLFILDIFDLTVLSFEDSPLSFWLIKNFTEIFESIFQRCD